MTGCKWLEVLWPISIIALGPSLPGKQEESSEDACSALAAAKASNQTHTNPKVGMFVGSSYFA